jgi:CRISPR-associated protein Cas2
MRCLVVYDITDDRARDKVADVCKDYGLDRIQYSAFLGELSRNHQEELILRAGHCLGDKPGNVQLFPVCQSDWEQRIVLLREG